MSKYRDVRECYEARLGKPTREALFMKDDFKIGVLKWNPSPATAGVSLYATIGASDYPMPHGNPLHRQEFFVGFTPGWDDIADPLAQLGSYSQFNEKNLDTSHILRLPESFAEGIRLTGFLIVSPLDGFLPSAALTDGRHVEFLMAIPVYPEELDFAAQHGVEDLRDAMEAKEIPFWKVNRQSTF
ncbi:suppressor of fused domain protein [Nonomuraea sp. H19]|uniref:suppressor of fused domain protein n=1 Tax=Nonomuraea sp. H19 TaxID=3452206 RepID=UPI003F8C43F2